MPRAETVLPAESKSPAVLMLRPGEIDLDPAMSKARPQPLPENEQRQLEALASSMREVGQIVPVVVEAREGAYWLVDGRRRVQAAALLEYAGPPFKLSCVVQEAANGAVADPLRTAIHANLKRRGYTPLQLAYLCEEIRKQHGWTGSREVAGYLGVSRAQVSQHDKLLRKPEGMSEETYRGLLAQLSAGRMGAETAFYALTHVEPSKAGAVLEEASQQAAQEASRQAGGGQTTSRQAKTAPGTSNARREASGRQAGKAQKAIETASKLVRIEKKHVKAAAERQEAVKGALHKTLPDLQRLFDLLSQPVYPDILRGFISLVGRQWWGGQVSDKQVIARWEQIAAILRKRPDKSKSVKK